MMHMELITQNVKSSLKLQQSKVYVIAMIYIYILLSRTSTITGGGADAAARITDEWDKNNNI